MNLPTSDLVPFTIRRVVAPGRIVNSCPRVQSMRMVKLDVENLKTMEYVERSLMSTRGCSIEGHTYCKGHLQVSTSGEIGLPQYVVNDEEIIMDERARANIDLFAEGIDSKEFATRVRSTMLGKRGMLRGHLMSVRPMTGARGVATCVWTLGPGEVLVPRTWMEAMKLPYRRQNEDGLLSAAYLFRPLRDGDPGVILRCPVISVDSIRPVRFYAWDNPTIGVSPELCSGMKLDFDGDEVHFASVSTDQAAIEIASLLSEPFDYSFSPEKISSAMGEDFQYVADENLDFMMNSTCSLDELEDVDYDRDNFPISRCKESSRSTMVDLVRKASHTSTFVGRSFKKISEVTKSHLSVSDGYTFARQLKIIATESRVKALSLHSGWRPRGGSKCTSSGLAVQNESTFFGFPAVLLVTKLTNRLIQSSLDLAKHKGNSDDTSMVLSLFANLGTETVLHMKRQRVRVERRPMTDTVIRTSALSTMVSSTKRSVLSSAFESMKSKREAILVMLDYVCQALKIRTNDNELADLANLISISLDVKNGNLPMTATSPVRFLSETVCNYLTISICENANNIDSTPLSLIEDSQLILSSSSPIVAIASGAMNSLLKRSLSADI